MCGKRRIHSASRLATFVGWVLAFAVAGLAGATDPEPDTESDSVERAFAMLKEGADGREIVTILEPLGYENNSRAQFLLGAIYFDGKGMPRDVVQGYAWLEVATTSANPAIADQAKKMLLASETGLSGGDLIRADQRAAEIRSAVAERSYERYGAGVRQFTTERPISFSPTIRFGTEIVQLTPPTPSQANPGFRIGCAAADAGRCPKESRAVAGPRCTGRIVKPDTDSSLLASAEPHLGRVYIPYEMRRRVFRGTTQVVVHVDRSGWICSAAIAVSSGEPLWDATALTEVTLWRLKPAMRQGEAVEDLKLLGMTARLN